MSAAESVAAEAIVWGTVLIAGIIVLGVVIWMVRRWSLSKPASANEGGWSLQHLRTMKSEGRITEEEFQALKSKVLEAPEEMIQRGARATSAGERRPKPSKD